MNINNVNEARVPKPFEEAISLTGFGKFNLFSLIATGGSLMSVIIETMCAMFIVPAAQCDLKLTLTEKGLLSSVGFLGVVASSHIWGYLADTKGRKQVVYITLFIGAVMSIIGSFVTHSGMFIFLRFCNGFFVGGSSAIVYAYVGEFHDSHYRPKVVSWTASFIAFGNMYVPGMAWFILPQQWHYTIEPLSLEYKPWRLLMLLYTLPSIVFGICVYFLPESPKYLLTQGKHDEVLEILRKMYRTNTGKDPMEYPVSKIIWEESDDLKQMKNKSIIKSMWKQTTPLFQKTYFLKTILVCYLQFANFLTSSAVIMWYPQILNMLTDYGKVSSNDEVTMCKAILFNSSESSNVSIGTECIDSVNDEVFMVTLIVGLLYLFLYIFMGSVINYVGPRTFSVGLISITTLSGILAQVLKGYVSIQVTLGAFLMGATSITAINAMVVELYPTQIRGMALAISLMFGRIGAMTGSNVGGPLMYSYCDYMFYILAIFNILFIICVILIPSQKSTKKKEVNNIS